MKLLYIYTLHYAGIDYGLVFPTPTCEMWRSENCLSPTSSHTVTTCGAHRKGPQVWEGWRRATVYPVGTREARRTARRRKRNRKLVRVALNAPLVLGARFHMRLYCSDRDIRLHHLITITLSCKYHVYLLSFLSRQAGFTSL